MTVEQLETLVKLLIGELTAMRVRHTVMMMALDEKEILSQEAFDQKVQEILNQQGDQLVQQYWEMLEKEIGGEGGGNGETSPPHGHA